MNNKNVSTSAAHFAWSDTQTRLRQGHRPMTLLNSTEDGLVFSSGLLVKVCPHDMRSWEFEVVRLPDMGFHQQDTD